MAENNEKVKMSNLMLELLFRNEALKRLQEEKSLSIVTKFRVYRFIEDIRSKPGFVAYLKAKEELLWNTAEKRKKEAPGKEDEPLMLDSPFLKSLLEQDSGVEVEKLKFPISDIPADFTVKDMSELDWLVNFVEE